MLKSRLNKDKPVEFFEWNKNKAWWLMKSWWQLRSWWLLRSINIIQFMIATKWSSNISRDIRQTNRPRNEPCFPSIPVTLWSFPFQSHTHTVASRDPVTIIPSASRVCGTWSDMLISVIEIQVTRSLCPNMACTCEEPGRLAYKHIYSLVINTPTV